MDNNLQFYERLKTPPQTALKAIQAGRLKGKSDINPQWRIKAMTDAFGPCGIGWWYTVTRKWAEKGANEEVFAFVDVELFVIVDGKVSAPISGTGGSMLVEWEGKGNDRRMHNNDEAYKMATTDALSVAMKQLGVAGDVYEGLFDGSKYQKEPSVEPAPAPVKQTPRPTPAPAGGQPINGKKPVVLANKAQQDQLIELLRTADISLADLERYRAMINPQMTEEVYFRMMGYLKQNQKKHEHESATA